MSPTHDPHGIIERASAVARASGLPGRSNGPEDALRHMLGSAHATMVYGERVAKVASDIRESVSSNSSDAAAMDRHNDAIGRELGKKYDNMWEATAEAMNRILGEGEGRANWITDDKASDLPDDARNKVTQAAASSYRGNERDRGSEYGPVDDDDLARAEDMASTARIVPDEGGGGTNEMVEEQLLELIFLILMNAQRKELSELEAVLQPDIPPDLRLAALRTLAENLRMADIFPAVIWDAAVDPESRRKLFEEIRKRYLGPMVAPEMLQPEWTDPARAAKAVSRGGGAGAPAAPDTSPTNAPQLNRSA